MPGLATVKLLIPKLILIFRGLEISNVKGLVSIYIYFIHLGRHEKININKNKVEYKKMN